MKQIITTFLILLSFYGYAQKSQIKGAIKGIDKAVINVLVLPIKEGETPIFDTTYCANGEFKYTINYSVDMWHLVTLSSDEFKTKFGKGKSSNKELKNREIVFFIKPQQKISISASIAEYGLQYSVTGNDINTQMSKTEKMLFPLAEEFNRLTLLKEKTLSGSKEFELYEKEIKRINNQMDSIELSVISKHPDWVYSAELLPKYSYDTIAKYYNKFTPSVKNSFFGKHVAKTLKALTKGSYAPSFTLPDINGKNLSLSDFKGKYIVLDFWCTWSGSCIKGFPKLKEYYTKYKDKIEFIGIDCLDDIEPWKKATVKYELDWINLYSKDEVLTDNYGITGYPTKFIIDKEGKIVLKSSGEDQEFYDTLDELFK